MFEISEAAIIREYGQNSEFFKQNKKILHYSLNGFSRVFVLWIIKYYGPIHGYEIMKELDKFFIHPIKHGIMKKSTSSKVYPILKSMEDAELIAGEWETTEDNKQVKFYTITHKGKLLLNLIGRTQNAIKKNEQWNTLFDDFNNNEW